MWNFLDRKFKGYEIFLQKNKGYDIFYQENKGYEKMGDLEKYLGSVPSRINVPPLSIIFLIT